ncbi:MAG TPA: hypothetical protein VMU85_18190, partial [Stellaceae bacterium]|nr:hypothetical protein [Stellaceae bacterium]
GITGVTPSTAPSTAGGSVASAAVTGVASPTTGGATIETQSGVSAASDNGSAATVLASPTPSVTGTVPATASTPAVSIGAAANGQQVQENAAPAAAGRAGVTVICPGNDAIATAMLSGTALSCAP